MAQPPTPPAAAPTARPGAAPEAPAPAPVDDSHAVRCYANFCRVTGGFEELIIDFGLAAQPADAGHPVRIDQQVILNFYTAKRLLRALHLSVERHEKVFGTLETDVQKRVKSAPPAANGGKS